MATLILTSVGGAIGGPIGAAIGAVLGQQADARLFAPKARHGPRLGELAVQTSSYGVAIPKIFGTMRVAGTVIWSTDLKEEATKSGGGKGRPKTVSYSYSASFAVALSGRPIRAVRRIWADGKLLRGVAGDLKSETGFRLHLGTESQMVDPIIAASEGQATAHRGIAYALFEDFQLADFGNRIPSLTFEVEADPEPVEIGTIAEILSEGEIAAGETPALSGYAATGDSIRSAIETLADVLPLSLAGQETKLVLAASPGAAAAVTRAEQDASGAGAAGGRGEIVRRAAGSIAGEVSIAYHAVERDFQTGLQRASRGGPALRSDRRSLAAALSAGSAKAFAEARLASLWAGRETASIHLAPRRIGIAAGAHLRIEGLNGLWKVSRRGIAGLVVTLELVRVPVARAASMASASPGRAVEQFDGPHGPTSIVLLDLPNISGGSAAAPLLFVAAAGVEPGWRRAALMSCLDGGASWEPEGSTAAPATMGHAVTKLEPAGSALLDVRNGFEIELLNDAMWLESRTDAALINGANLALIGDEIVQFGRAEPIGGRRFRLSHLLRGRRGTEWATLLHAPGEAFILLDQDRLSAVATSTAIVGAELKVGAQGLGDGDEMVIATRTVEGRAMQPPAPVHLRADVSGGGDIALSWVRRSRTGWTWPSGSDTPLGEEGEAYRLLLTGSGFQRSATTAEPQFLYSARLQAEDGFAGAMTMEVVQLGTHAPSRAARLALG